MTVIIQETIFQRAHRDADSFVKILGERTCIEYYESVERAYSLMRNAIIGLDRHKRGLIENERQ
jgi:hypothetical protein